MFKKDILTKQLHFVNLQFFITSNAAFKCKFKNKFKFTTLLIKRIVQINSLK